MRNLPFNQVIGIHSNPRSGSTWLAQIFDSSPDVRYKYQPLKSRSFSGRITDYSNASEIYEFYKEIYSFKDDYLDQNFQRAKGAVPENFQKLEAPSNLVVKMVRYHYLVPHLLENIEEQKIIGIVRNPCDYLNSWRKAPKEFLPEWNFDDEWYFGQSYNRFRSGEYYGFNRWKEVTKLFLEMQKQYPDRFYLVRYEDLVNNTMSKVEEMFAFCGMELSDQTKSFINKSQTAKVDNDYSVFRAGKDIFAWKQELNPKIIERVEMELQGTELEQFLTI